MKQVILTTTHLIFNKAPSVPQAPTPAPTPTAPTTDNSEEVKKQKLLEEQRQKRAAGLGATDNTGGDGVSVNNENIDTAKATDKTLLGS